MSGYLQRMVAGAARPVRTMHPLVGGVFVKEQRQGIIEESAVVSARSEPARIDGDVEARGEALETQNPERLVGRPVVDRGLQQEEMAPEMRGRAREDDGAIVSSVQKSDVREPLAAEEKIQARRVHTLLMPEVADHDSEERVAGTVLEAIEHRTGAEVSHAARTAKERAAAERAARKEMERGSEDIQIHIGRIEVIAVQPPLQRAAPAVTRKSESLEDYLRRRDRRAR